MEIRWRTLSGSSHANVGRASRPRCVRWCGGRFCAGERGVSGHLGKEADKQIGGYLRTVPLWVVPSSSGQTVTGESGSWLAWWPRIPAVMFVSVSQVGLDASAAVLDRRIRAHAFTMQLDQVFLGCAASGLVGMFFESP